MVLKAFQALDFKPSVHLLPDLLSKIQTVFYNGEYDLICNHLAAENMLDNITWNSESRFDLGNGKIATTYAWIVDDESAGSGRFAKKSEALSAEEKSEKCTIMDESDVEQLVIAMKEGIENETIHNDELITLWKKTFGYRRSFIRSHTINEILEKFPDYSDTHFMFEEVKMIENIDIELSVNEILPRLFDKLPNNSLFVMGTTSPTTALALLLSLYNVYAIKFAKNNHTSHILYGVFFQNADELGKNLRIILNSWHFTFED
ncbi:unnamed protein product [Adineta steineri]|uniref:Uncharacterized protein n=1 Tax=Adineta steineri TaxID=433720 RepID=A0A815JE69_9BILA|nr:unnamed protein product [Adineta steineri]CAF3721166.1 unnamed protein product [Adineta steineri]